MVVVRPAENVVARVAVAREVVVRLTDAERLTERTELLREPRRWPNAARSDDPLKPNAAHTNKTRIHDLWGMILNLLRRLQKGHPYRRFALRPARETGIAPHSGAGTDPNLQTPLEFPAGPSFPGR